MSMTKKEKARVIQGAIIPAAASGTLWDIPTNKACTRLRTQTLNAIWGQGRKMRCPEIVLGIINDPTRIDPIAAITFKRISDARRLMRKSHRRLHLAIHTFEVSREPETDTKIHATNQGPIVGLRQAAIML